MSRELVTTVLDVAGSVALVVGATMLAVALGWLVGGVLAIAFSWRMTHK